MVGLLARESLDLSSLQYGVLVGNSALWLTARSRKTAMLALGALLWAFWGHQVCFDTRVTWKILAQFQGRLIPVREIGVLAHLSSNPPTWSWFVSLCPSYPMHQVYALSVSGLILGLCQALYGDRMTRLIAATPLFQLCCTQPLPGLYALACVLAARRCWQLGWKRRATLCVVAGTLCKYTVYALLPWVIWTFRGWSLITIGGIVGYWMVFWLSGSPTFLRQAAYLTHVFSWGLLRITGTAASSPDVVRASVSGSAAWRLPRFLASLAALPWYGWPLLGAVPRSVSLIAVAILLGGGNIKYLLLVFGILPLTSKTSETLPLSTPTV